MIVPKFTQAIEGGGAAFFLLGSRVIGGLLIELKCEMND
jgi:hypothetical protein